MSAAVLACRTSFAYVPNGARMWVASPNRITAFFCTESIGVAATPSITGLAPPSVPKNDCTPTATPPSSTTLTFLLARNFCAQTVPGLGDVAVVELELELLLQPGAASTAAVTAAKPARPSLLCLRTVVPPGG